MKKLTKIPTAIWVLLIAAVYYCTLCAKTFTWVFQSSDSGDWLMTSNWFVVPQPYGSPLYILLMRLLGTLPGDTAVWATILLSCLPSAVTVMLVYLIVKRLTTRQSIASASAAVLLGSSVFLTQSTVLEEYALATMLLTSGFWTYLSSKRKTTALCWGLGASIHVFVLGAVLFWLIIEWRSYLKPLLTVTIPIVATFYCYILLLMHLDTPRVLAGGLNVYSLEQYLTVTGGAIVGQLSIFEAPKRLLLTSRLLLMSFGLALIPLAGAFRKPLGKPVLVMLGVITWTLWYQITCLDPLSWTFITYASPFIAILVGLGLSRLNAVHLRYVAVSALVLVAVNAVSLNASTLTNEKPLATTYYGALQELPDGSIIVCEPGAYSLGLYYAMSEGKDLIPLVYPYMDDWKFWDYGLWLERTYGIETYEVFPDEARHEWKGTLGVVGDELGDRDVYFVSTPTKQSMIRRCLTLEDTQWYQIKEVTGLTGLEPELFISWRK